jgi:hypothetical protein
VNIREDRPNVVPAFKTTDGLVGIRDSHSSKACLFDHFDCVLTQQVLILNDKHDRPMIRNRLPHSMALWTDASELKPFCQRSHEAAGSRPAILRNSQAVNVRLKVRIATAVYEWSPPSAARR